MAFPPTAPPSRPRTFSLTGTSSRKPISKSANGRHPSVWNRSRLTKVRRDLFQTEGCLPLADFDIGFRELVPVNENVRGLEGGAVGGNAIAVFEVALDLEVELLGEIAD